MSEDIEEQPEGTSAGAAEVSDDTPDDWSAGDRIPLWLMAAPIGVCVALVAFLMGREQGRSTENVPARPAMRPLSKEPALPQRALQAPEVAEERRPEPPKTSAGKPRPDRIGELQEIGRCHIGWGEPRDVVVNGNHAFVATAESSYPICIYDISDPAKPAKVGMIEAADMEWPTRVFAEEGRVYIPSRFRTVGVVDVSDVTEPKRLANLNVTDRGRLVAGARSVVVDREYAYVTVAKRGVMSAASR